MVDKEMHVETAHKKWPNLPGKKKNFAWHLILEFQLFSCKGIPTISDQCLRKRV